jgi:hypothetical protein
MSEQTHNQQTYPVNLDTRRRGHVAELAFMRKAASLGFAVAKPYGEGERYDVIVSVENVFWRIQVKSVLAKTPSTNYYRIKTAVARGKHHQVTSYSPGEIDFLVTYVFQEDIWYVFPASIVETRKIICMIPGSKRSRFEKYLEAWDLMKPIVNASTTSVIAVGEASVEPLSAEVAPSAVPIVTAGT